MAIKIQLYKVRPKASKSKAIRKATWETASACQKFWLKTIWRPLSHLTVLFKSPQCQLVNGRSLQKFELSTWKFWGELVSSQDRWPIGKDHNKFFVIFLNKIDFLKVTFFCRKKISFDQRWPLFRIDWWTFLVKTVHWKSIQTGVPFGSSLLPFQTRQLLKC